MKQKKKVVMDAEIYSNYSLFSFSDLDGTRFVELSTHEGQPLDRAKLRAVLNAYTIISFNGINFDLPIAFAAIAGADCAKLKEICGKLTKNLTFKSSLSTTLT